MRKALEDLLERYVGLVNADASKWDPETDPEVIAAREALAAPIVAHTDILIVDPDRPTPSRESSDALAALAAKYLGMEQIDFAVSLGLPVLPVDVDPVVQVFADIQSLAGSVVSQARGDK